MVFILKLHLQTWTAKNWHAFANFGETNQMAFYRKMLRFGVFKGDI